MNPLDTILVLILIIGGAGLIVAGVTMLAGPAWGMIAGGGFVFAGGVLARFTLHAQ